MFKVYKALGGLIEVKYVTGVDVDKLEGEDLIDLEDTLSDIKKKVEEKRPELKKKEEKEETLRDLLGDDDIPYEVRMKYIIKAYMKDQEKWSVLMTYAKHLEEEVMRYKNILIINGYADNRMEGDKKPAQVIHELREKIKELNEKVKTAKDKKTKKLKQLIEVEYPLRQVKTAAFKRIIKSQKQYISELQELLDKNDIIYAPKEPANDLELKDLDKVINMKALRQQDDLSGI